MLPALLALFLIGQLPAQDARDAFHFQRQLDINQTGWYQLELPNELFGHLQPDLDDLRIRGITAAGDTIEAPYLIEWPRTSAGQRSKPFRIINQSRRADTFYATLAAADAGVINRIELDLDEADFDWSVRLEGSTDQREWYQLLDGYRILSFQGPNGDYRFSTLHFPDAQYPYYRISIRTGKTVRLEEASFLHVPASANAFRSYPIESQRSRAVEDQQARELELRLPWPVPVSQVHIPVLDTIDYYRPLRIELLTDSTRTEKGWNYHYTTVFRGVLSSLEEPVFTFPTERTYAVRILLTHYDNRPLELGAPQVKGAIPVIRTRITEPADYVLLYGAPDVSAPSYDLVRFRDRIPEEVPLVTPGPEIRLRPDLSPRGPLFANRAWLWAVMILVIGLLGWFSVQMLRNE